MLTRSEALFEQFCAENGIPCRRIPTGPASTPDYRVQLRDAFVTCEVKQIDPNRDDRLDLDALAASGRTVEARWMRNRLSAKLKNISRQLRDARDSGEPTLLVVYDNTPFRLALDHDDVVVGMFGELTFQETIGAAGTVLNSRTYFGKNRRIGPACNRSVSAIAVLQTSSEPELSMDIYHNPFAAVTLAPALLTPYSCRTRLGPDDDSVTLW